MERGYDHANDTVWSLPRLEHRFTELQLHIEKVKLSPERLEQIHHEMACIAFEGLMRRRETNQREAEIEELNEKLGIEPDAQFTLPFTKRKPNSNRWKRSGQE